jgi:hypothetical protein
LTVIFDPWTDSTTPSTAWSLPVVVGNVGAGRVAGRLGTGDVAGGSVEERMIDCCVSVFTSGGVAAGRLGTGDVVGGSVEERVIGCGA